jgi:hypothetical protein
MRRPLVAHRDLRPQSLQQGLQTRLQLLASLTRSRGKRRDAIDDPAADAHAALVQPVAKVQRLLRAGVVAATDQHECGVGALQQLLGIARALHEAVKSRRQITKELQKVTEHLGAGEAGQAAHDHRPRAEHPPLQPRSRPQQQPEGVRVEQVDQPRGRIQKIKRVGRWRRVQHHQIVVTRRRCFVQPLQRHVLLRPRQRRRRLPVVGVVQDAVAALGVRGIAGHDTVKRALHVQHRGVQRLGNPASLLSKRLHRDALHHLVEGPKPQRIRQSLRRVDRQHQRAPSHARCGDAQGRGQRRLAHATRADADQDLAGRDQRRKRLGGRIR